MNRRLLASYLTITVLLLLILEVPLGTLFARSERRNLINELRHDALILGIGAEATLEGEANVDLQDLADTYAENTETQVVIVDSQGTSIADSDPPEPGPRNLSTRPEIAAALQADETTGTRHSDTLDSDLLYVAVPIVSDGRVVGAVRLTHTLDDRVITRTWLTLAVVGMAALVIVAVVSWWLSRSITRPLRSLEAGARALAEGHLDTRVDEPSDPRELRTLATSFNAMAARLEHLVASQQAFLADASHQLRTPLAALRLRLENLEAHGGHTQTEATAALNEVQRLSRLVDGLLALARTEAGGVAPEPIDIAEIVDERLEIWGDSAAERQVELARAGAARALSTPGHLEQILDNLLANALAVAPSASTIEVVIEAGDPFVEIHVIDRGPGMSSRVRERAFDRFWQSPEPTGSTGLGLAIVKHLVEADGGEVDLRVVRGGGLDVVLRLRTA